MSLRSLLLRVHAGWVHLFNHEPPEETKLDAIGGQAVVEGVLMRAPGRIAVAARAPDGTIAIQSRDFVPFSKRRRLFGLPVLRGAVSLIEALYVGTKALNWSAAVQERPAAPSAGPNAGEAAVSPAEAEAAAEFVKPSGLKDKLLTVLTLVVSFALALGLFQLLPYAAAAFLTGGTRENPVNPLLFNSTAGAVRITLLLLYMWGLSFLPDVRRLFQYHGAEHKSIFAHESGAGLSTDSVDRQTRFHPRCGTSFILIVALTCILFFSVMDAFVLHVIGYAYPNFFVRFLAHLPFVPFVAGLSFEFLKLSARHQDSMWIRPLIAPGLWLQRITTKNPDASQIEVAIASAKAALRS